MLPSHLSIAVTEFLKCPHQSLSFGEHLSLKRFLDLSLTHQKTIQRLATRKSDFHRADKTSLSSVAIKELLENGHLIALHPTPELTMSVMTLAQLSVLCRRLKIPRAGAKKKQLIERLRPRWKAEFGPIVYFVAHRNLFRRISRWYTTRHDGDLTPYILQDLGLKDFLPSRSDNLKSLFSCRSHQRGYEYSMSLIEFSMDSKELSGPSLKKHMELFRNFKSLVSTEKFSPLRRLNKVISHFAHQIYPSMPNEAVVLFGHMDIRYKSTADLKREALLHHQLGSTKGLALIRMNLKSMDLERRFELVKTHNYIASRSGASRYPKPHLALPFVRRITLQKSTVHNLTRPMFKTAVGDFTVEKAVVGHLKEYGHYAIHSEGTLWESLVALLFIDALCAPIPNVWPSPVLSSPIDFRSDVFTEPRKDIIDQILKRIRKGEAENILLSNKDYYTNDIKGLLQSRYSFDTLHYVCRHFPGYKLAALLALILYETKQKANGMPDLLIFTSKEKHFPIAFPKQISYPIIFAELKTKNDFLSSSQHCWLHRLCHLNLTTELWQIETTI